MNVQIKIFETKNIESSDKLHWLDIENQMNTFLLSLDGQRVLAIEYKYLMVNSSRPKIAKCTGYIIYEI